MTAIELLTIARREKPGIEYATNPQRNAIAARRKPGDEWEMVAGLLPGTNEWVTVGNLYLDGRPVVTGFDPAIA